METAYIGIGSNLGNREDNCRAAIEMTGQVPGCRITGRSDFFLTKPVGVEGQEWYVNGVISLSTSLSAKALLGRLMGIEADMGRVRKARWDARTIDLDILLFGREIIEEDDLKVPHPLMHLRKFVLVPMVQLAPNLLHPLLGMTMAELLEKIPEGDQVVNPAESMVKPVKKG